MRTTALFLNAGIFLAAIVPSSAQTLSTVQFTAASYSVSETGGVAIVTVERVGEPGGTAFVEYFTSNGTATDGEDYTAQVGSLQFNGETNLTITIPILNDALVEGNETVFITLLNPIDTVLGERSNAELVIRDNDAGVEFTRSGYLVAEDAGTLSITVQRLGDPTGPFTVDYALSGGAYYVAQSGTLSFGEGQANATFTISILNDAIRNPFQWIDIDLSKATGGVPLGTNARATVEILDNDFGVEFVRASLSVIEGQERATIKVQRRGDPSGPFTVDYATSDGSATAGADYQAVTGTLSFADGETNRTITIPLINDVRTESYESLRLSLRNPTGGQFLGFNSEMVLTIVDDDGSPLDSWIPRDSGTYDWLKGVTYGNGLFVAVGKAESGHASTILTSPDGQAWVLRTNGASAALYDVTYGEGKFVAVGGDCRCGLKQDGGCSGVIWSSRNGEAWSESYVSEGQHLIYGVTFAGGTFVAVGGAGCWGEPQGCPQGCISGLVLISHDGLNWTERLNGGGAPFKSVMHGNGTFVAVGNGIWTSPDGEVWTERATPTPVTFGTVAYGEGVFVVACGNSSDGFGRAVILSSVDAFDWTERYASTNFQYSPSATFGNGTFAVMSGSRRILTSPDGVQWTERDTGPNCCFAGGYLDAVTFGNNTFVAIGFGGTILQSAPIIRLTIGFSGFAPALNIAGPIGSYRIETTTELNQTNAWSAMGTIAVTNSPQAWIDPQATNLTSRFYRAVLLP